MIFDSFSRRNIHSQSVITRDSLLKSPFI